MGWRKSNQLPSWYKKKKIWHLFMLFANLIGTDLSQYNLDSSFSNASLLGSRLAAPAAFASTSSHQVKHMLSLKHICFVEVMLYWVCKWMYVHTHTWCMYVYINTSLYWCSLNAAWPLRSVSLRKWTWVDKLWHLRMDETSSSLLIKNGTNAQKLSWKRS